MAGGRRGRSGLSVVLRHRGEDAVPPGPQAL